MNKLRFIFPLFLLFVFSACQQKSETAQKNNPSGTTIIRYARFLQLEEISTGLKITIINPDTHQKKQFFLGTSSSDAPTGYQFVKKQEKPRFITLSSTHIGMLSKIKALDQIAGISDKNYVYQPQVIQQVSQKITRELGSEGMIPFESVVATKAPYLFFSGYGKAYPKEKQLEKLGITCFPDYDWQENHPLGKAEWIKLFGYLAGKEQEASDYFDSIEKAYKQLAEKAKQFNQQPTVFSGDMIGDFWICPAGESYASLLFHDAHSKYTYSNTKGVKSLELSFEKILADNAKVTYWFNPGNETLQAIIAKRPTMRYFEAVKNKNVYGYSHNNNYYWEMSAIEPHHILSDLITILHPELLTDQSTEQKLYFYRQLTK